MRSPKSCSAYALLLDAVPPELVLAIVDRIRELEARAPAVPAGWKLVPEEPTEDQWSGLARFLFLVWGMEAKTAGCILKQLERLTTVPQWLRDEPEMQAQDHFPSKGTRAAIVYKAMIAAAPEPPASAPADPAAIRNAALEEAAALVERMCRTTPVGGSDGFGTCVVRAVYPNDVAEAVRALKTKEEPL